MKQPTIEEIELDIEIALACLAVATSMKEWEHHVRRYHALNIKWFQMRGERPIIVDIRTDYIINKF